MEDLKNFSDEQLMDEIDSSNYEAIDEREASFLVNVRYKVSKGFHLTPPQRSWLENIHSRMRRLSR